MYLKTPHGQYNFDDFVLRVPLLGPLVKRLSIAQFSRTLSALYSGGVSITKSLKLVSGGMRNVVMEKAVEDLLKNLKEGETLAATLRSGGIFTNMSISMISIGEETGTLDKMLDEIAGFYEMQADTMLRAMAGLIEPVVIVFVGCFVALLIVALGMPLLNLVSIL